jgi:tetrapyrrole methylase family protein / MazG family protein
VSLLDEVGKSLPGLVRAFELQKRAAKVGFDWTDVADAWNKVKEEIDEVEAEFAKGTANRNDRLVNELGDLYFALVNVTRFYGIHPEEAVHATNRKFYDRFRFIEDRVKQSGKGFDQFTLEELDQFWEAAKTEGY